MLVVNPLVIFVILKHSGRGKIADISESNWQTIGSENGLGPNK